MTDHPISCQSLETYLDGQLQGDRLAAFEQHLKECSACTRAVELQASLDQLLAPTLRAMTAIDEVSTKRLAAQTRRKIRIAAAWSTVRALAALLLVAFAVWSARAWFAPPNVARMEKPNQSGDIRLAPGEATSPHQPAQQPSGKAGSEHEESRPEPQRTDAPVTSATVQVEVPDNSPLLPIRLDTEDSNVTIIWFHPVVAPTASHAAHDETDPSSSNLNQRKLPTTNTLARRDIP